MMMGVTFTSFDDCILGALMEANAVAKKTLNPGGHESGNLTGGRSMAQQILTETDSARSGTSPVAMGSNLPLLRSDGFLLQWNGRMGVVV